jgi:cell division protein FtsZ
VVTKPFTFEGPSRKRQAEHGLAELASVVDTVITIPNDQLMQLVPKGTSFFESFRIADDVLRQAVQGISDIITTPGIINRDFSDIRNIMLGMGYAMMGTATASGENASIEAARKAISCPLMEAGGVRGARGILINITASSKLSLHEVNEACSLIREACDFDDAMLNFGVVMNESMGDDVKITVIATGFQRENLPVIPRKATAPMMQSMTHVSIPQAPPAPPIVETPGLERRPEFVMEQQSLMDVEPVAEQPVYEEAPALAMAAAASAAPSGGYANGRANAPVDGPPINDLDTPAFLRRDKRFFQ